MKKLFIYFIVSVSLWLPAAALAHLEGGLDITQDTYTVDFGHTPEFPTTGEATILAINVLDNTSGAVVDPEKVWLRISGPSGVVFAGYLATDLEHINLSYIFQEPGEYQITARFPNIEAVEEVTLPLQVTGESITAQTEADTPKAEELPAWYMKVRSGITGLLVIIVCILIVKYYTNKQARNLDV